ncbi:MAG: NAD(P)/FAD-dependent oxidoreductase [Anaerolineaceae bacterium]|nr:NAD(P)/FAD-dependent oxidoreductase [Anaerolineaceae bacterium]
MANYDVIVVGAGPGGTAAAKVAAEKKLKVLLLERGRTPGDKNMSGSYLFRNICEELFPGFQKADFHKGQVRIGGIDFRWLYDNDEKRYGMVAAPGAEAFRDMMMVYRNESDEWLAKETVKAGAELKTALATDLIWENKEGETPRVIGVVTDQGNFEAPVVIDASGLNSLLAHRSGLVNWGPEKITIAIKYIYRVDGELLRQRLQPYKDDDGVEVEWGAMPTMCGEDPAFWGTHAVGCPDRGIVNIIVYHQLASMLKARVNIHQRAQWYLTQPPVNQLIEGGEFIQCNFHCLNIGDKVGYPPKSYLPGYMMVGDAGGYGQPVEDFGANVAQVMGKIAAETAAEMKAKKDYSEAMFAKYEERWHETWILEDNVPELNYLMGKGGFQKIVGCMDDAMSTLFKMRFNNNSFPSIALSIIPKMAPALPALLEAVGGAKPIVEVGMKKAGALMALMGTGENK